MQQKYNASFSHNYLSGYFEITVWPGDILYFIDYNQFLGKHFADLPLFTNKKVDTNQESVVHGFVAYAGQISGPAVLVNEQNLANIDFPDGAILICDHTDIRYLPFMRRAGGIITDRGGILSHAAIVARELKKPCLVNCGHAQKLFKTGDIVALHADEGKAFMELNPVR